MKTSDPRLKEFRDSYAERNHVSALRVIGDAKKAQKREENWEALYKANANQSVEVLVKLHAAYWKGMHLADIIAAENRDGAWCANSVEALNLLARQRNWKRSRARATGSARWYCEDNSRYERIKVLSLIALFVSLVWAGVIWRLSR